LLTDKTNSKKGCQERQHGNVHYPEHEKGETEVSPCGQIKQSGCEDSTGAGRTVHHNDIALGRVLQAINERVSEIKTGLNLGLGDQVCTVLEGNDLVCGFGICHL
jgi:hypothetical protein